MILLSKKMYLYSNLTPLKTKGTFNKYSTRNNKNLVSLVEKEINFL